MNVVTRADVERFLDLASGSSDSLIDRLITDVSAMLARHTGRAGWGPVVERTEYRDGGKSWVLTDYWPIVTATIYEDRDHAWPETTVIAEGDRYIGEHGIIWYQGYKFTDFPGAVKIVYTGGYANVAAIPEIVKAAALRQIEAEYNMRRRSGGQRDMQTGVVLPEIDGMLTDYKRIVRFA